MPTDGFDGERHARKLAPAGVLLAAAGILVGGWLAPLLITAGVALLVLAATSARDGVLVVGPFAQAEMLAAARRGRVWRWRAVYVLVALAALYLSVFLPPALRRPQDPPVSASVYTQRFFLGAAATLFSYLTHLAFAVVAPVAAEEREKKRWEMLLTTDLRNREILFGKIAGRLPGLFEPLFAVLPVLCVLPLLGGVSPVLVGCAAVVTLSVVFGIAAASLLSSVFMPTSEKALNQARGLFMGLLGGSGALIALVGYPPAWNFPTSVGLTSPVEVRHVVEWLNAGNPFGAGMLAFVLGVGRTGSIEDDLVRLTARCAAFWVAVGGLLTLMAVARLRGVVLNESPTASARVKVKPVPARPPVPDLAVSWWAEYGHLTAAQMTIVRGIDWWAYTRWLIGSLVVLGFCRWWEARFPDAWPYFGKVADVGGPFLLVIWGFVFVLVPLFAASGTIAKERAADTLQSLVLTDLSVHEIVWQKWWGVLRPLRHAWMWGLCWTVACVATGCLKWWMAPPVLLLVPLLPPCWAAIGLGFSAHASTPAKAGRNLGAVVFGGGYGLAVVVSAGLGMLPPDLRLPMSIVVGVLVVVAQPVLGLLAFRYAVRRLEREYA